MCETHECRCFVGILCNDPGKIYQHVKQHGLLGVALCFRFEAVPVEGCDESPRVALTAQGLQHVHHLHVPDGETGTGNQYHYLQEGRVQIRQTCSECVVDKGVVRLL